MTSQLSAALRAAAAGIHPDEAGTGLIISHGTPMAWIDWDAVITALDTGLLPASGGEKRTLRVAASLAAGHPVSLRDTIPGLDEHSLDLVTAAIRHAAGQRQ